MRVLKNLLGDGSKIHADEIVVEPNVLLGKILNDLDGEIGINANGTYLRLNNGLLVCYKVQLAQHGTLIRLPHGYTRDDYAILALPSGNNITLGYNANVVALDSFILRMYEGNDAVNSEKGPVEIRVLTVGI